MIIRTRKQSKISPKYCIKGGTQMEEKKRGRGRPRLDTHNTEAYAPSRRQAVNSMYMFEAVQLISEAATEIPDSELLWYSDNATHSAISKNGILDQIGRMRIQDKYALSVCIYFTNLSIAAVKNGCTCREIEKSIRSIRLITKEANYNPDNAYLQNLAEQVVVDLCKMGGYYANHLW